MSSEKIASEMACEALCDECIGSVRRVLVDWPKGEKTEFSYCLGAIEEDIRRGFTITEVAV